MPYASAHTSPKLSPLGFLESLVALESASSLTCQFARQRSLCSHHQQGLLLRSPQPLDINSQESHTESHRKQEPVHQRGARALHYQGPQAGLNRHQFSSNAPAVPRSAVWKLQTQPGSADISAAQDKEHWEVMRDRLLCEPAPVYCGNLIRMRYLSHTGR